MNLDVKDSKIIANLDLNARMPMTQLAKKIGLSRQVTEYRIKKLIKEKIILGPRAIFDSGILGYGWYRVLLRMKDITPERKSEMINWIKNNPFSFWLGEVGGNWDLVFNFVCKDHFQFNKIIEELLSKHGKNILSHEILIYLDVYDLNRNYISKKNKREFFYHQMNVSKNYKIDQLDKDIISEINQDAWVNYIKLGRKLNVSGNTIRNRIQVMEKNNFLLGFRLFINPLALGYQSHMLFLEIEKVDLEKEKALLGFLKQNDNVTFLVRHLGKWRIGLEIETKTEQEFQDIFVEIRSRFSDIISNFEAFPLFKDSLVNYFPEGCLN